MAELLIENRGRDQKDLGKITVKGEQHHVILGSADDNQGAPAIKTKEGKVLPGQKGQWSDDFPNPVQPVDAQVWNAYAKDKTRGPVIKAWIDAQEITINGRASF